MTVDSVKGVLKENFGDNPVLSLSWSTSIHNVYKEIGLAIDSVNNVMAYDGYMVEGLVITMAQDPELTKMCTTECINVNEHYCEEKINTTYYKIMRGIELSIPEKEKPSEDKIM